MNQTIHKGGFFDRHPILVPASIFFICWIPYLVIFFRRTIAFGDLGQPYPYESMWYWFFFVVQLGVCVISHSLTIRTIVRLYAPRWLIWGSIAFYALSPAWGLMTAADIRHPLFAAVFCVFTSSCVFALYSERVGKWLWVQLAGGALSVCLLRAEGIWIILPTLIAVFVFKMLQWKSVGEREALSKRIATHFSRLAKMSESANKKEEALWSDMCAAFLVLSAVGLLFLLTFCVGWALPLGEPSYGAVAAIGDQAGIYVSSFASAQHVDFPYANLTGTEDVGGIIPFATIADNSVFASLASAAANLIFAFQCLPVENLAFSWVFFLLLFAVFTLFGIKIAFVGVSISDEPVANSSIRNSETKGSSTRTHDFRPLILALAMIIIIGFMLFVPADISLRYLMPVLAAQPMFFGACFASSKKLPSLS